MNAAERAAFDARWEESQREGMRLRRMERAAPALLAALKAADRFITNGIALGFIRMPDPDVPDPAKDVPEIVKAAIAQAERI